MITTTDFRVVIFGMVIGGVVFSILMALVKFGLLKF